MEFFRDNWLGLLIVAMCALSVMVYKQNPTVYSPSGHSLIMQDHRGPDYCMVDIGIDRTGQQVWTDLQWCLNNAKEIRKEAGLP